MLGIGSNRIECNRTRGGTGRRRTSPALRAAVFLTVLAVLTLGGMGTAFALTPVGDTVANQFFLNFWTTGGIALESETSNVTMDTVVQSGSVTLVPNYQSDSVYASGTITYRYDLINRGNGNDTFLLAAYDTIYTVEIYSDANRDGIINGADTIITAVYDLPMNDSVSLILKITTPETVTAGTMDTSWVAATALGDARRLNDTAYAATLINASALVKVIPYASSVVAGETLQLHIALVNVLGETLTYSGTATLSVDGGTMTPVVTSNFSSGSVTLGVQLTMSDTRIITATIGSLSGTASVLVLPQPPPASYFDVFGPDSAAVGETFALRIIARDDFGNTITSYVGPVLLSDYTGTISPSEAGNFVNGETTVTVAIYAYMLNDMITVCSGAACGTHPILIYPTDTIAMVHASAQVINHDSARIRVHFRDQNGMPRYIYGETYVITLERGNFGAFTPNPQTFVSSGGSVTIYYTDPTPASIRFKAAVQTLMGDSVVFERIYVQIEDNGSYINTLALPMGTQILYRPTVLADSDRAILRGISGDSATAAGAANANLPGNITVTRDDAVNYNPECEVVAYDTNNVEITDLSSQIVLIIPYRDSNGDGRIDGSNVNEAELRIYRLNVPLQRWEVEQSSSVNTSENYVSALLDHLSIFTLLGSRGLGSGGDPVTYPNPFYPFERGRRGGVEQPGFVTVDVGRAVQRMTVKIYNINGDLVRTLDDLSEVNLGSGTAIWDGRNDYGQFVASGVYLYHIDTDVGTATGKMTVIK